MLTSYLKIIGATLMISPLVYASFSLGGYEPLSSTICLYIPMWIGGILCFNYLENGDAFDFTDKSNKI